MVNKEGNRIHLGMTGKRHKGKNTLLYTQQQEESNETSPFSQFGLDRYHQKVTRFFCYINILTWGKEGWNK